MADEIYTQGGAVIQGDVNTQGGTFIGRDQIILISGYTGEQLELVVAQLREVLRTGQAEMQADLRTNQLHIHAPDAPEITLSKEAASDLLSAARRMPGERAYLAALMVHPKYARWAQQFVPLAGTLTAARQPLDWSDVPPEFTLLEMHGEGPQRQIERIRLEDITEAVEKYPQLALLGEPGAGKTTTLYRLGWQAARQRLQKETGKLPLFVPLADFGTGYGAPDDFVRSVARQALGPDFDLHAALRRGEMLLLIDALNEMPFATGADYRQRVQAWRRFAEAWPGNQMIFTCRSLDYSEPLGLPQVEIERLDDRRVQEFLRRYLPPALAESTWARLDGTPLLDLVRNPYYLSMLAFVVAQKGDWPRNRARLFESFEQVLWERETRRNHPEWPGAKTMRAALSRLGYAYQQRGEGTRMPRTQALAHLKSTKADPEIILHLALSASLLDTESPPNEDAEEQIRFYHHQLQEYFAARALLQRFAAGEDLRRYWKQPRLKREMPSPGKLGLNDPLPPPPPTGWEETTILAAALSDDLPAFVQAVEKVNPVLAGRCLTESGVEAPEALKDRLRQTLLRESRDRRVHLRYRIAAGEALGRLGDPRFTRLETDNGEVLLPPFVYFPGGTFRMGSSPWEVLRLALRRFPVTDELPPHEVTLPPFWMAKYPLTRAEYACFVRAGGYQEERYWPTEAARAWLRGEDTGGGPIDEFIKLWRTLRENPTQWKAVQGQFTPQQRQGFEALLQVEDEDELRALLAEPYQRERTQPAFWEDARFSNPAQPVVGVTWYEALAYCRWLEEQLTAACPEQSRRGSGQVSGEDEEARRFWEAVASGRYRVTLPSEAEWEYAARAAGEDGLPVRRVRRYPWGNRWRAEAANSAETHILRPTPVGVFPAGDTPAGLADMGGNVWEWTRSLYQKYPYQPDDGREELEADGYRVVRGGSWSLNRRSVRAAFRGRYVPEDFDDDLGFRVVLSLAKLAA